jgi:hypothetical protein
MKHVLLPGIYLGLVTISAWAEEWTTVDLSRPTLRAQSPDGASSHAEEQYNSGLVYVTEPSRPPLGERVRAMFEGSQPLFSPDDSYEARPRFESDHCFDSFISPVSNPFFFEDPRSLTELRPIFIYQKAPGGNPLFRGGDIEFFALQGRLAITDNLSLVIHKLGFVAIQPGGGKKAVIDDAVGFAELQLGPKFTFYRNDFDNLIAAAGLNFEIPAGGGDVFQDTGDGGVTPYLSVGKKIDNFHLLGTLGYRFSFNDDRSESFFLSLHGDYSIFDRVYPLVELNWYHYTENGDSFKANFEGADLFNFGSTKVEGHDFLNLALGGRFKIQEGVETGLVFEFPLTGRDDLMDYRFTLDLIFRY